jgi:head-tail adaptor
MEVSSMKDPGKYRYRVTIQSYNATTNAWGTYTSAWAMIDQTGADQVADGDTPHTLNSYTVRIRFQPSKTITTSMRISWTTNSVAKLLYINGVQVDAATMKDEMTITAIEETR